MLWLKNKKMKFLLRTLTWRPVFFHYRYGAFSFGTERSFVPKDFGSSSPTLFRTLAVRGTALVNCLSIIVKPVLGGHSKIDKTKI